VTTGDQGRRCLQPDDRRQVVVTILKIPLGELLREIPPAHGANQNIEDGAALKC
jgi:hypothetical protein